MIFLYISESFVYNPYYQAKYVTHSPLVYKELLLPKPDFKEVIQCQSCGSDIPHV